MPKAYPPEFRSNVIAVARQGAATVSQVAADFGTSESCLQRWLSIDDRRVAGGESATDADVRALREARKRIALLEQEKYVLRQAAAYLSRGAGPKIIYPLVRELAAAGNPTRVPAAVTCRVLKLTTQGYYKWLKHPVSQRDWDDAHLIDAAIDIHRDDPEFGYRFIADQLGEAGYRVSENRVARLCALQKIYSVHAKTRGRHRRPGPPVRDDLVERKFRSSTPDTVWLTDITEHSTRTGKLYLSAVKDTFSNRIVGYSMTTRMTSQLAVKALNHAVAQRNPTGTVVHSDRGGQFRSVAYANALAIHGLRGSMGRVATCADNAAMESFFSLLQKNVLNRRRWDNREQLSLAIAHWIERTYHRPRRQRALSKLTPIEFETINQTATAA
ncbi:IS3 family transposase [Mycobacteroides stephanolepidis]|uniref:IS3 family transposase n=1 Tax=[Mycobacterium] stephanolepidis TaxID=1520670 RepID=UPI000BBA7346|nr:IS3 family transposase [[Mycobacterium] stephanolepidis]